VGNWNVQYFEPPAGEMGLRGLAPSTWSGQWVLYVIGEPVPAGTLTATALYRFLPLTQSYTLVLRAPSVSGVITWYKGIAPAPFPAGTSPTLTPSNTPTPFGTPSTSGSPGTPTASPAAVLPPDGNNLLVCKFVC
jgi:hypothetical protein